MDVSTRHLFKTVYINGIAHSKQIITQGLVKVNSIIARKIN
jgi:hypothetical protein